MNNNIKTTIQSILIVIIIVVISIGIAFTITILTKDVVPDRFKFVEVKEQMTIMKDRHTDIVYMRLKNGNNESMNVLYNKDGKPMSYKEYLEEK